MIETHARSFADVVGFDLAASGGGHEVETHGTTVLALRYDQGCLVLADRRATMGNLIMYERAEKIVSLDDATVVAISGSFARSIDVTRYLQHSFKYFERMNLHELSLEGKLMEISRALAGNLPNSMNGIGVFLPIVAAYDPLEDRFGVYFFDAAGARFEGVEYACAGSGSERIRGVFEYLQRTLGAWEHRAFDEVAVDGLRMLDIAAQLDSATGGIRQMHPMAVVLTRDGVRPLAASELEPLLSRALG